MDSDKAFEREKWPAELELKKRELDIKEREQATREADLELRKREHAASAWRNPLTVAVFAAAAAAAGNAVVTVVNGNLQRDLENSKAESTRILEMIKTGETEAAAHNLDFLLKSGLVSDPVLTKKLGEFLKLRAPGSGPSLPSPGGRVGFEQSDSLNQALQDKLQTLLNGYFSYLDKVGFPPPQRKVIVKVEANSSLNAFYVDNSVVIDRRLADDPSVPLHEYSHHVLTAGKSEWQPYLTAIESGLADYFTCSFLDNPRLGERSAKFISPGMKYIRNLLEEKSFADLQAAGEGEYAHVGVWGSVFWKLREKLGRDLVDAALASTWLKANMPSKDAEVSRAFVQALLAELKSKGASSDSVDVARSILKARGFPS